MAGAEIALAFLYLWIFGVALAAATAWGPVTPGRLVMASIAQPQTAAQGNQLVLASLTPVPVSGLDPEAARLWNASNPQMTKVGPASPFILPADDPRDRIRAINCLTAAIYYEAGHESTGGQRAVAQVVLNRLRHPAFPKTVCGVVFEGSTRATGCQFTFTCDGSLVRAPTETGWRRARQVAEAALDGGVDAQVGYATHYHADYVAPYWSPSLQKVATVGTHIFYRRAGGSGQPSAFAGRYLGQESDDALRPAAPEPETLALDAVAVEPTSPAPEPRQIVTEVAEPPVVKLAENLKAAPISVPAGALQKPKLQDDGRARLALPRDSF
jgi:hypothetical protein